MKYHDRKDYPRKCEGCGGPTANMKRHGYQAFEGNEYFWKKFMCMTCGKIMKRKTGYVPVLGGPGGVQGEAGYTMDKITPKRLNQNTKAMMARTAMRTD